MTLIYIEMKKRRMMNNSITRGANSNIVGKKKRPSIQNLRKQGLKKRKENE